MSRTHEKGGLYQHATGLWYRRRVDSTTGRRVQRSTGTRSKARALREAARLNDVWEKAAVCARSEGGTA